MARVHRRLRHHRLLQSHAHASPESRACPSCPPCRIINGTLNHRPVPRGIDGPIDFAGIATTNHFALRSQWEVTTKNLPARAGARAGRGIEFASKAWQECPLRDAVKYRCADLSRSSVWFVGHDPGPEWRLYLASVSIARILGASPKFLLQLFYYVKGHTWQSTSRRGQSVIRCLP
jgi:hypothetical protein